MTQMQWAAAFVTDTTFRIQQVQPHKASDYILAQVAEKIYQLLKAF